MADISRLDFETKDRPNCILHLDGCHSPPSQTIFEALLKPGLTRDVARVPQEKPSPQLFRERECHGTFRFE